MLHKKKDKYSPATFCLLFIYVCKSIINKVTLIIVQALYIFKVSLRDTKGRSRDQRFLPIFLSLF